MLDIKRAMQATAVLVAAGSYLGGHVALFAGEATSAYPKGYRTWAHVKSTLIGPQAPGFASNGGLHHFYANEQGLEGYRTGKFPDGAVLVDDLLEVKDNDAGVTSEGARRRLAVMTKDSRTQAATGGWSFEVFRGDSQEPTLTSEARAACFACHAKSQESVFTKLRP